MSDINLQENMQDSLPIVTPEFLQPSIIKVMGVGGGGCNAVNYLYNRGVEDVSFLVCNTDRQALEKSPVPSKLQLGKGLGAGGRPEAAQAAAEESRDNIREALDDGTQMLFITAGMGGGTGTGASPVVAEIAQEMGILTVGIVTIPFAFEGKKIIRKALRGIARLAQHVDALLVINNEKLRLIYPDFDLPNAFNKSDEVVSNAAKSIAEIITVPGYINTDFQDVYNTLRQGGVAIMNVGTSDDEEHRISKAIQAALTSPLVNNTNVHGAKRILLNFYCSHSHAVRMTELDQINEFIDQVGDDVEVKWGASYDDSLGPEVRVTLIATGYPVNDIPGIDSLEEEEPVTSDVTETTSEDTTKAPTVEEVIQSIYGPLSKDAETVNEMPIVVGGGDDNSAETTAPAEPETAEPEQTDAPAQEEEIIDPFNAPSVAQQNAKAESDSEEEIDLFSDAPAEPTSTPVAPKQEEPNVISFEEDDLENLMANSQPSAPQVEDTTPAWLRRFKR